MAKYKIDLSTPLGTGLSTSSYPAPNSLTTKNPYSGLITDPRAFNPAVSGAGGYSTVSSAWTSQGQKMLLPIEIYEKTATQKALKLAFMRSSGSSVTAVTIDVWVWVFNSLITGGGSWCQPASNPSRTYTLSSTIQGVIDYFNLPGTDPIYIQITSTTGSGNIDIFYDASVAEAL